MMTRPHETNILATGRKIEQNSDEEGDDDDNDDVDIDEELEEIDKPKQIPYTHRGYNESKQLIHQ